MRRTFLEAGVAIILLGLISVLVKAVSANAITIGVFRLAVAVALMLTFRRTRRGLAMLSRRQWLVLVLMGLFFGAHWLLFFLSIKMSTASIAVLALSSYGIHLLWLGRLLGESRPGAADFAAVLVAVFGNLLIIPEFSLENHITLGVLLGLLSGLFFAFLPILHQKHPDLPASVRVFGQFFFALVFFMLFFPLTEWHLAAADWIGLVILAVPCTLVAHTLWVRVTTKLSTLTSSLIYYLIIPVSMFASYFFLCEEMTPGKVVGAALIISANLLGLSSQRRRRVI